MDATNLGARWQKQRLSRRRLIRGAAVGAAGAAGLAVAACGGGSDNGGNATAVATAAETEIAPQLGTVEQQKALRIRTGLTAWDSSKAFEGYTLFSPNEADSIYLIAMNGNVVHRWDLITDPEDPRGIRYAYLLDNGNLFVHMSLPAGDSPMYVFKGGIMMEIGWEGEVLWEFEDTAQHHDARMLPNGNLLLLRVEEIPSDVADRLQGGRVEEDDGFWADWVVETTLDGDVVWEWHAWEHLDPEQYVVNPEDRRNDWTHGNSLEGMPDGKFLISLRNTNTVAIVDPETGEITWELGSPDIAQQHNASPLENGNVLIFDNGANHVNGLPFSRVIEVDIETNEIVWEYQDQSFMDFFSAIVSGAQRLPNGNTLIDEGTSGRLFEVTEDGEVVWEYISPFVRNDPRLGNTNIIFRAYRYPPDAFPLLV